MSDTPATPTEDIDTRPNHVVAIVERDSGLVRAVMNVQTDGPIEDALPGITAGFVLVDDALGAQIGGTWDGQRFAEAPEPDMSLPQNGGYVDVGWPPRDANGNPSLDGAVVAPDDIPEPLSTPVTHASQVETTEHAPPDPVPVEDVIPDEVREAALTAAAEVNADPAAVEGEPVDPDAPPADDPPVEESSDADAQ